MKPKTIEEKISKVIDKFFTADGKEKHISELTKAIMEIVEEEKTNPPTPSADKAECKHGVRYLTSIRNEEGRDDVKYRWTDCKLCISPQPDEELGGGDKRGIEKVTYRRRFSLLK